MVRFLIFFELVLVVLLVIGRMATPSSDLHAHTTGATTFTVDSHAPTAPPPPPFVAGSGAPAETPALSATDRAVLARDLVGAETETRPTAVPATEPPGAPPEVAERDRPVRDARETGLPKEDPAGSTPDDRAGSTIEERLARRPAPTADVADAQRLLARLGHPIGPADGVAGPRTRQALRDYARQAGITSDGALTRDLLTQLRRDARRGGNRRGTSAGATGALKSDEDAAPEWAGSIAAGLQRLLGHEFDSLRQPRRLYAYCRTNPDNWIFDEGRRTFTYCGQVAALR